MSTASTRSHRPNWALKTAQTHGRAAASVFPSGASPIQRPMMSARSAEMRRLGAACGRHPWRVLAVWIVVLAALFAGSKHLGATYSDNVNLSGTQSNTGLTLLQAHAKGAGGYSGTVVEAAGSGTLAAHSAQVDDSVAALSKLPHVISVTNPLSQNSLAVSANGQIGYSTIEFNTQPATLGSSYVSQLDNATSAMRNAGIQVQYGGGLDQLTRPKATDLKSELVGFAVALIVLLLIFGSILGAVLPLVTALVSVLAGISILGIVAAGITFGTSSPTLAAMIGIGVGIDYAVFLTTRFRQQMIDGADPAEAGFGVLGFGVFGKLKTGGFQDPGAESTTAQTLTGQRFGGPDGVVLLVHAEAATVDDAPARAAGAEAASRLAAVPGVSTVVSYWQTRSPGLRSKDGKYALILGSTRSDRDLSASELASLRSHSRQVDVTVGGSAAIGNDILKQVGKSLRAAGR